MKKLIPFFVAVILFANISLLGETIHFKSGEKLEGSVLSQDKDSVTIKLVDGNTKVFPKSMIRKVSFAKKIEPPVVKIEPQVQESEQKRIEERELAEKLKRENEELKVAEEKRKKREEQLTKAKRHYLEGSLGVGSGENQSELRPFFQAIQLAGLLFGGGDVEFQSNPYKTKNQNVTARLFYAWNRFTFEIRGTEAKGNFDVGGFQTLSVGSGSPSSSAKTVNVLFGNGDTKFQKVSARAGFTPFPHPLFDFQIVAGVERIWTKTIQETASLGEVASTGFNPTRASFRETNHPLRGYSIGIGYEWKFWERFILQGQILYLDMKGPSSFRSNEFGFDLSPFKLRQFGLDYQWRSTGSEVNVKFSTKVYGDLSFFMEASNMILNNKLDSGYITENDTQGNSDLSQIIVKAYAPQILIPVIYDSKTILTYVQVGANYRLHFGSN